MNVVRGDFWVPNVGKPSLGQWIYLFAIRSRIQCWLKINCDSLQSSLKSKNIITFGFDELRSKDHSKEERQNLLHTFVKTSR